jgi:hypothetical protein
MNRSLLLLAFAAAACSQQQQTPARDKQTAAPAPAKWTPAQSKEILAKTETIRLAPDLSHLGAGEKAAVAKLIEVGQIFQDLYEQQRHAQALSVRAKLAKDSDEATLYRLFQGPIATTLDNKRVPFVDVAEPPPGKNVYPLDLTAAEYGKFVADHPDRHAEITNLRSVVRRADSQSLKRDLDTLTANPALDLLHPGLKARLEGFDKNPDKAMLYAVPYSVAYPDETLKASGLLNEAADAVAKDDEEFAGYLRNRARDLLSDDYESGDAAWVTGRFKNLNAMIGAYETYDDELSGTRAFYGVSILARRPQDTDALAKGLTGLQAVEDALPYDRHKKIRADIPVGVYDVIADFGQARGGNTATILPNEAYLARRYGRTILLRSNIMRNPQIFASSGSAWGAVVAPEFASHLTADGQFNRTLWHEVGHYLGVDRTRDGRDLDVALGADGNLIEEMKADLVSLFAGPELQKDGYFTADQLRSHYASGIMRTLQNVQPRRDQPYQTMQLMTFNWFMDKKVLRFDPATAKLSIDYAAYHAAVESLLRELLAIQDAGDPKRSDAFIRQWSTWDEAVHGKIAAAMRAQQKYRYRLFTYAAIDK